MSTSYTYDDALQIARDAEAQGYALLILTVEPANTGYLPHLRLVDLCNPENSKINHNNSHGNMAPTWVGVAPTTLGALFAEMQRQDENYYPGIGRVNITSYELRHRPRAPLKMEAPAVRLGYSSPAKNGPSISSPRPVPKFTGDRLFRLADIVFVDETVKSLEKQFRMAMVREYFEAGEKGPPPIGVRFSRAFTPRAESFKGMVHKTVVADIKGGPTLPPALVPDGNREYYAKIAAEPGSKVKIVP